MTPTDLFALGRPASPSSGAETTRTGNTNEDVARNDTMNFEKELRHGAGERGQVGDHVSGRSISRSHGEDSASSNETSQRQPGQTFAKSLFGSVAEDADASGSGVSAEASNTGSGQASELPAQGAPSQIPMAALENGKNLPDTPPIQSAEPSAEGSSAEGARSEPKDGMMQGSEAIQDASPKNPEMQQAAPAHSYASETVHGQPQYGSRPAVNGGNGASTSLSGSPNSEGAAFDPDVNPKHAEKPSPDASLSTKATDGVEATEQFQQGFGSSEINSVDGPGRIVADPALIPANPRAAEAIPSASGRQLVQTHAAGGEGRAGPAVFGPQSPVQAEQNARAQGDADSNQSAIAAEDLPTGNPTDRATDVRNAPTAAAYAATDASRNAADANRPVQGIAQAEANLSADGEPRSLETGLHLDSGRAPGWRLGADPLAMTSARAGEMQTPTGTRPLTVGQQLSVAVSSAQDGQVELRLDPPELGRVQIQLQTSEDGVRAVVMAERAETQDLLRRNAEMLSKDLAEAGFGSVSLDFTGGSSADDRPAEENQTIASLEGQSAGADEPIAALSIDAPTNRSSRGNGLTSLDIRL